MRAVAAAAVVLTGCFYIDPIVTPVHVDIRLMTDDNPPRQSDVTVMGALDTGRPGMFRWHVCAVGDSPTACDEFRDGEAPQFDFRVPVATNGQLVTKLVVTLDARDDRGVFDSDQLTLLVRDGVPTIELDVTERRYAAGVPIHVFALYGDPEFAHEQIDLDTAIRWEVTPAIPIASAEVPPPAMQDETHILVGKRLVPPEPGTYVLTAQASDPTCLANPGNCNRSEPVQRTFEVAPDQPPCLAQWQPIAPPAGQTLPLAEPTVFQVPLVTDELDAFPRTSSELEFGTAKFAWSLLRPGAAQREPIAGANGNRIVFDPGAYRPGDIAEVRVEVTDRNAIQPTCADAEPTCAMTPDASCLQRQTWRVEVR